MATKQFYAARDFKYRTRMMRAGDPVEMSGPDARLYAALGAVSTNKPRRAAVAPEPPSDDLNDKTKAELAKLAGLSPAEAKKLTKAQIIAKLR